MCDGTRNAELSFLHLVGSAGHVVLSGAFGARNVEPQFSCLGGPSAVSIKSELGHITPKLCFRIWWDMWVTSCIPMRLGWAWCSFHKKRTKTRYAELVYLYPVGSTGQVVHSDVSGT
jgi:hypothetical protein